MTAQTRWSRHRTRRGRRGAPATGCRAGAAVPVTSTMATATRARPASGRGPATSQEQGDERPQPPGRETERATARGSGTAVPTGTARCQWGTQEVPCPPRPPRRDDGPRVPGQGSATATTPPRRLGEGRRSGRRCGSRTGRPPPSRQEGRRVGPAITASPSRTPARGGAATKPGHQAQGRQRDTEQVRRHQDRPGRRPARAPPAWGRRRHGGDPDGHQPEQDDGEHGPGDHQGPLCREQGGRIRDAADQGSSRPRSAAVAGHRGHRRGMPRAPAEVVGTDRGGQVRRAHARGRGPAGPAGGEATLQSQQGDQDAGQGRNHERPRPEETTVDPRAERTAYLPKGPPAHARERVAMGGGTPTGYCGCRLIARAPAAAGWSAWGCCHCRCGSPLPVLDDADGAGRRRGGSRRTCRLGRLGGWSAGVSAGVGVGSAVDGSTVGVGWSEDLFM